jgi:hypothetical protein
MVGTTRPFCETCYKYNFLFPLISFLCVLYDINNDASCSVHSHLSTHDLVSTKLSCWIFMQFGTGVLDKRFWSKHEFVKSGSVSYFTEGGKLISTKALRISWLTWLKFGIRDLETMLLIIQEKCNYVLLVYPKTIWCFESKEHPVNSVHNVTEFTIWNLVYILKQQVLGGCFKFQFLNTAVTAMDHLPVTSYTSRQLQLA